MTIPSNVAEKKKKDEKVKGKVNNEILIFPGLISSLKMQLEEVQKAKERSEKLARDAVAEVKRIREPLELLIANSKSLKEQLTNYDRDKDLLRVVYHVFGFINYETLTYYVFLFVMC